MKRLGIAALLLAGMLLAGAAAIQPATAGDQEQGPDHLQRLARWMTGSFSSARQAETDSSYFDIRLEMARIPSGDGRLWLYVEQATAASLGTKPYRQRVYRLEQPEDGIVFSHVYTIPGDPLRFAGAYDNPMRLAQIPLDRVELLNGCSIELRADGDERFVGETGETSCANQWGDAAYATSQVTVTAEVLLSWDRGYNQEGQQVWGATAGPYVFDKVANRPLGED